jgi:hypothetical protein
MLRVASIASQILDDSWAAAAHRRLGLANVIMTPVHFSPRVNRAWGRERAPMALKTFGVEAVLKRAIPGLIIFSKDKRYDAYRDVQTEETIKSIRETNGGFRITESLTNARRLLGFRGKRTYFLKVLDPITIEIWDGTAVTRYAKCGSGRAPFS